MLSSDLVRARRRGETLVLQSMKRADRESALEMCEELLQVLSTSEGQSAEEVNESLSLLVRESRHEKLWLGLKKLILDECQFGMPLEIDAPTLRARVFQEAAASRQQLGAGEAFERSAVLEKIAEEFQVSSETVEEGLFGDLKGAQRLIQIPVSSAADFVERYELAQIQGVMLKAVKLTAQVSGASPETYRQLFQKLKFRQLLYRLEALNEGYRIEIEGPFSLFDSVTKYGLALALIVPALHLCGKVELEAELRWGKERKPLSFKTSIKGKELTAAQAPDSERPEVKALLKALEKKKTPWSARSNTEVLDIPGVGLCIPDLRFEREGSPPVYLELLGYWSRDAVWKRVEWAQAGGLERVVFALSSRLRVSQEVLPEENHASLYVFKGAMSAASVLAQVQGLSES